VAADVALDAIFPSAETRFIFPELLDEGLAPHHVGAVWLFGSERRRRSSTSPPRSTRRCGAPRAP